MLDWAVIATRWLQFMPAIVLFGSPLFFLYGLGPDSSSAPDARVSWPRRLLIVASAIGFIATMLWFMAETASLTGDPKDVLHWTALWSVVSETRFGQFGALRVGLLIVSMTTALAILPGKRQWIIQTLLGGALVGSFAWTGHGAMNDGAAGLIHLGSDVLHLLAASVWIGALLPLSIMLVPSLTRPQGGERSTARALDRFSGIGPLVVSVLILTGLVNSWFLISPAHWRQLLASAYGRTLALKLGLFAAMLVLATVNRFRLAPRLRVALSGSTSVPADLRDLRISVLTETAIALLVIAAVAVLGTLEPPISGD